MSKLRLILLAILVLLAPSLGAVEGGLVGGPVSKPKSFTYGLSVGSGTLVPLLKVEFEGWKVIDEPGTTLTAGAKIRPKFGKFAPYGMVGGGVQFERITFHFSQYNFFTFFGGGVHFFPVSVLSLRFDIRLLNFPDRSRLRLSAGLFLHL